MGVVARRKKPLEIEKKSFMSSWVDSASYDPAAEILRVIFNDRAVVKYFDIPSWLWADMKRASSVGHFVRVTLAGYRNQRLA